MRNLLARILRTLLFVFSLSVMVASLRGQNVSIVRKNSIEVGPFVGLTYGLDATRVLGGGNVTYAVTRRILPYVEYSYFPGLLRRDSQPAGSGYGTATTRIPFNDIHAGVHIRFPIRESPIVPYAVIGFGTLFYSARTVTYPPTIPGLPVFKLDNPSSSDFAANFGGGVRYYMGQRAGVRLEGKIYKPTGQYTGVFGKLEVGLFYQFR